MKEKDKEVEKAAEVGHEQVEEALLSKFDTMKAEEADVQGACSCEFSTVFVNTVKPLLSGHPWGSR